MTYAELYDYYKEKREREMCFGIDTLDTDTFELDGCQYFMKAHSDAYDFELISYPDSVEVLEVPDFVTGISIPANKVGLNTRLKKVILNDRCRVINEKSFESCVALKEINLKNISYIGNSAFKSCISLKDIEFGSDLKYLGNRAFSQSGITSLKFNSCLDSLCSSCFSYCRDLLTVDGLNCLLPATVYKTKLIQGVHGGIFRNCNNLKKVSIGKLDAFTEDFFWHCENLEQVEVKEQVAVLVGNMAFYKCNMNLDFMYRGVKVGIKDIINGETNRLGILNGE